MLQEAVAYYFVVSLINEQKSLTIFPKSSIIDVRLGSKYTPVLRIKYALWIGKVHLLSTLFSIIAKRRETLNQGDNFGAILRDISKT